MDDRLLRPILVGKIVASFGLQGWVKVLSLSAHPCRFAVGTSLWVGIPDGEWKRIWIEEASGQGEMLSLRLRGVSSREEAAKLRGLFLAVDQSEVEPLPEGNFYHFELLGLVVKERGVSRGEVVAVIEGPAYDYLLIRNEEEREFFLPFLTVYVKRVDVKAKSLEVECPEGFWE